MMRRFRSFGALVALLAFSAYFAESIWAAACPPDTGVESGAVAGGHGAAGMPAHHGGHDPAPAEGDDDAVPLPCPFAAIGASGCVSASLGAAPVTLDAAGSAAAPSLYSNAELLDTLVATVLFHPPRA
jgi:hypothetical protein